MRQPPHELMLFAAGFGSRMQPLTSHLPKPLIPVAGISLLDRTLTLAEAGGITKTVVNTHYLGDKIARHLENRPVQLLHEPNILDTGGGLKMPAASLMDLRFLPATATPFGRAPIPFPISLNIGKTPAMHCSSAHP